MTQQGASNTCTTFSVDWIKKLVFSRTTGWCPKNLSKPIKTHIIHILLLSITVKQIQSVYGKVGTQYGEHYYLTCYKSITNWTQIQWSEFILLLTAAKVLLEMKWCWGDASSPSASVSHRPLRLERWLTSAQTWEPELWMCSDVNSPVDGPFFELLAVERSGAWLLQVRRAHSGLPVFIRTITVSINNKSMLSI